METGFTYFSSLSLFSASGSAISSALLPSSFQLKLTNIFTVINQVYDTLGYQWASSLLAFVSILVTIPMILFYWKGAWIRQRSKFAKQVSF